jgi:hypothetical protein
VKKKTHTISIFPTLLEMGQNEAKKHFSGGKIQDRIFVEMLEKET